MSQTRRVGSSTSVLARFRRCKSLSIRLAGGIPHPSLLAGWLVAGVGADVARNITTLSLEGAVDLPTLTTVSLVLAGTLRHVHTLTLNTDPCGAGGFRNLYALHSALRGAFPTLEELCLPAKACLRGLEAFAGSALHTVRVMRDSPGCLRLSHVRSLLQLPQLRHLDLAGEGWGAYWDGSDDIWDDLDEGVDADDDEGIQAGADEQLALGDATLLEALLELGEAEVQELWALRRLLASAPPAMESLRLPGHLAEVDFEGGTITRAATSKNIYEEFGLRRAAAALVPRLEATGQRLPLFEVNCLVDGPADVISLLQPHSAFVRLLAKCDRVELGLLDMELDVESVQLGAEAAAAAEALQAVARAMGGGLPNQLSVSGPSWYPGANFMGYWGCTLQTRPRCKGGGGGRVAAADGRGGSGVRGADGAAMAAPAAVMELTAEQVLERAADKIWAAASAQGAASMAEAAMDAYVAAGVADSQEQKSLYKKRVRMNVLLRGPLVWQLTCGPGAGGEARLLTDWLCSLVAAGPPPPPAPPAAAPGRRVNAAAGATGLKMHGCSFAPCGSGSAMAVVTCDCPFTALQLHGAAAAAAAAAAACKTPSCLQLSAARAGSKYCWSSAIAEVVQELWDDHLSSVPQPAAAAARAAAPGAAAGADGPADGGGCGGCGGPAKTTAAGAGGESGRAPGGQPAGNAAAGGGRGDYDLQVLMHLLQLLEQVQAVVKYVDNA
ncbi:hypothetical protein HXX76_015144 [Chlamydomonas incerta]|uniref:Uncharacterized protein n=1 Tax=Chlamydomonas incerta TaxID=51695 RepID=A0A835VNR7_CHLIN|nr:hypothetical protein HXX76_015144 [Chlamydomonas incerta]|eukprot:KAG2423627.1 hypothetical protein HXX76_015144 [Chlamydomonas incerta]